ncbi:MAG: ABC transporter ATP-binding protein, partial [Anaerolineales bacterium]
MNAVEMRGITKRFGPVVANDGIDLTLHAGEILALLGENGAGKTTLMNILYGLCPCDNGEIYVRGKRARIRGARDALALKIGMVHQHFMLIARFTVAENVVLGAELSERFWFDDREAIRRTAHLARRYGFDIDPTARVWDLSVGVRQRVEILKALHRGAEVLILDEPTSVLTPQESERLFDTLRAFRDEGKAVVFITHKLPDVMAISDRVSILRAGRLVGTVATAETDAGQLARMMVGRDPAVFLGVDGRAPAPPGRVLLRIEGLSVRGNRGALAVRDLHLECRAGEIVGVAGVEGNGQMELVQALRGLRRVERGRITANGRNLTNRHPREINACGCCHIAEDRQLRGLMMSDSLQRNLVLGLHRRSPFAHGPFLNHGAIRRHARRLMRDFDIRAPGPETPVRHL